MKSPDGENIKITVLRLTLSIFSVVFVIGTSLLIYYFSKGYRLDFSKKEIRKTGVLTVESEPSGANYYINGENLGRTPRGKTLDTGIHTVSVWKKDYREWKKDVEILEERTTPIYPFLILENIQKTTLWESKFPIEKHWINKYSSHFIFLTQNEEETFTLWTYRINTPLWYLTNNPIQVLTLDSNDFDLQISPNGQLAILKTDNLYIIELQRTNILENLIPLELPLPAESYQISWAMDNKHIMLESEENILALDTSDSTVLTLVDKVQGEECVWTTDGEGFFYIVEVLHTEEEQQYIYAFKQRKLDGNSEKYVIEEAYFQKDEEFVQHYRDSENEYPEFSNSPQSTQTTGQITALEVNQSAKGVFIQTTTSSYWYNIETQKYRMIAPYPGELLKLSPSLEEFFFVNEENLYTFRFKKEEDDHTRKLGLTRIDGLQKENVTGLNWLSNSSYISYIEDEKLFISEEDGENKQEIVSTENILLYSIKNSREYIVTLEIVDDELTPLTINQYKIK